MENASKAIIMAGGVLIAMALISVAIYFYTKMSGFAGQNEELLSATQVQSFNSFYTAYIGRDIRVVDAINILNKAVDDEIEAVNEISVIIGNAEGGFEIQDENVESLIEYGYRLECSYDVAGKINGVSVK